MDSERKEALKATVATKVVEKVEKNNAAEQSRQLLIGSIDRADNHWLYYIDRVLSV